MSRIRTNLITNRMANGAPTVSNGLVISGVTTTSEILVGTSIKLDPISGIATATSFRGDGSQLTGIDATKIETGNTKVETIDTGSNGHIKITTEGNERLRITSDGKVGIATDEPFSNLTVYGENRSGGGSVTGQITAKDNAAWNASPTGGLIFQGHFHSNGANAIFGGITGFKENGTEGNYAGALAFHTRPDGAVSEERLRITSAGHLRPAANATYDLGESGAAWRNLYVNDAHFSNEGHSNSVDGTWGSWTLQEGENDIFMINNRTGKKYAITMKEVE